MRLMHKTLNILILIAVLLIFQGCLKFNESSEEENSPSGDSTSVQSLSGVAATGAPITDGVIRIKDARGVVVTTQTNSDGSYSADVSELDPPLLVLVEAPSGDRYISVAPQSILARGGKVNVTPLTHVIVANVFGLADGQSIYDNFTTHAGSFSETKLDAQKFSLMEKLEEARLLSAGKFLGEEIDLINGALKAGTSLGLDGLLDTLDVDLSSTSSILIRIKGTNSLINDDPADEDETPEDSLIGGAVDMTVIRAQLEVLQGVREALMSFLKVLKDNEKCNGPIVEGLAECAPSALRLKLLPFFHSAFQDRGYNREQMVWMWMCIAPFNVWVTSECEHPNLIDLRTFEVPSIADIEYIPKTKVALVRLKITRLEQNLDWIYQTPAHYEDIQLKKDTDGKFKLFGNKRTFRYEVDTESKLITTFTKADPDAGVTGGLTKEFGGSLNLWLDKLHGLASPVESTFTLTALSGNRIFPGDSATTSFHLVRFREYNQNICSQRWFFSSTSTPLVVFESPENNFSKSIYYPAECLATGDICSCQLAYIDSRRETQRLELSAAQVARMDRVERVRVVNATLGIDDEILIRKPFTITEETLPRFIPQVLPSPASFCAAPTEPIDLSLGSGFLTFALSTSLALDENGGYGSLIHPELLPPETNSYQHLNGLIPYASDVLTKWALLDVEARDEFDRRTSHKVICK